MNEEFSPIRHGARRGLPLGLFIGAVMLMLLASAHAPLLGLIGLIGACGVPVLAFMAQRESLTATSGDTPVSGVWLSGTMAFVCAALVCGVLVLAYLRWIDPTYLIDRLNEASVLLADNPDPAWQKLAADARAMVDNHTVPSGTDLTISLIWLIIFSGLLYSGLCAIVLKASGTGKPRKMTRNTTK